MEKSVLLEKIKECKKSYIEVYNLCRVFDLSDSLLAKLNDIGKKLNNNEEYVANTNIKNTTIDSLSNVYKEVEAEIKKGRKAANDVLLKSIPDLIKGSENDVILLIVTKNTKGYSSEIKNLITSKNGVKSFTKKTSAILDKYRKSGITSLTKDEEKVLITITNCMRQAYLTDS